MRKIDSVVLRAFSVAALALTTSAAHAGITNGGFEDPGTPGPFLHDV